MSSASPVVSAARPSGWIDLRKQAEYPIVLGDTVRDADPTTLLGLRYNWQPKSGVGSTISKLKKSDDGYRLSVGDVEQPSRYKYSGQTRSHDADGKGSLALVFDKKESVFKIEVVSKSIDLNLEKSATQNGDSSRYVKIRSSTTSSEPKEKAAAKDTSDDDSPDPSNPFDFRNFLQEARENAGKGTNSADSRTPLPGSRTPMGGFGSPAPGASRFKANTPQFKPTSASPGSSQTKKEKASKPSRLASPLPKKKTTPPKKKKPIETSKGALSKERISDSDDEMSDTIVVQRSSISQPQTQGHNRNISANIGRSPHIVVNDGDLEIDLGSPPQEARGRPRGRIDPGAFRSHTDTPVMGKSANKRPPSEDVVMKEADEDNSEDGDVEELELGSPRASRMSMQGSRSISTVEPTSAAPEYAPTPSGQAGDDYDDILAAELEAALEEGDQANDSAQGFGLGITGAGQQRVEDDESEVSEEE
jgi:hypothetical protein